MAAAVGLALFLTSGTATAITSIGNQGTQNGLNISGSDIQVGTSTLVYGAIQNGGERDYVYLSATNSLLIENLDNDAGDNPTIETWYTKAQFNGGFSGSMHSYGTGGTITLDSQGTLTITNLSAASGASGHKAISLSNQDGILNVNTNQTATQVSITGDIYTENEASKATIYFTGSDSSLTGNTLAASGSTVSLTFTPADGSTATLTGTAEATDGATYSLTAASGTAVTGETTASAGGIVNAAFSGTATQSAGTGTVVGLSTGSGSTFTETVDGASVTGEFEASDGGSLSVSLTNGASQTAADGTTLLASSTGSGSTLTETVHGSSVTGEFEASDGGSLSVSLTNGASQTAADGTTLLASSTGSGSTLTETADSSVSLTGDFSASDSGTLSFTTASTWTGTSSVDNGTLNVVLEGTSAIWNVTGDSSLTDLTAGSGTIHFPTAATDGSFTGTTVTVNGNYSSDGAAITMSTVLAGDSAATDKLVVNGNTSGTTTITFTNVGGTGAQTVDGIEVVEVNGTSDGVFTKPGSNYLKAGPYVYQLQKIGNSWYLTSLNTGAAILPNTNDTSDTPSVIPATDDVTTHNMRPEIASYANNLYAANTLFMMSLYERLSETMYSDALRGNGRHSGNVWIRTAGGHTRNKMEDGSLTTRGNWGLVQVGGDVVSWPTSDTHRFHLGLMAGYAHDSNKTTSPTAGYWTKGKLSGYSVGLYGTWMNQKPEGTGPYVDTWLLWQRFKNEVSSGDYSDTDTYHSKGFTVSLEGGYTFPLKDWKSSDGTDNAVRLQLQGQVIRMGVRDGAWTDTIGSTVQGIGAGNVRTRVGLKLYHQFTNDRKDRAWKPFIGLNWYHDTKAFGAKIAGVADHIDGGRNFGEVKLGVEGKVKKNWNVWGFAGYQQGSEGFRNLEALAGLKYLF